MLLSLKLMRSKSIGSSCLMLVDLLPDAAVHNLRTIAFPFLMGLSRLIGWRAYWCVLGVRYAPDLLYTLAPRDLRLLRAEVKRRKPRVVIINASLPKKQLADIATAAPGVRLVYWTLGEDLQHLAAHVRRYVPEARSPVLEDPNLLDGIQPIFRRKILNKAPWAVNPQIEVMGGSRCSYYAPVAPNPFYRHVRLPTATMGCSFCSRPSPKDSHWDLKDPVAFAVKQIEAACRQHRAAGAEKRLNLVGSELWRRFEELARALVQSEIRGVELNFMPRLDELLEASETIDRCLPLLAENGIALRINGLGVENFSPDENMRLHKAISAEQVHEAAAFLIGANARWPAHFRLPFGGFGMILFTPWTRLEDLRANLDNIERCPLIDRAFALSRRLMLFRDVPITQLAEQDGLLVKQGESIFYNAGCKNDADRNEIPWRFAHTEVGILWDIARRLSSDRFNIPADDPLKQAADAFITDCLPGPFDPLPLFREAVETLSRHPKISSAIELLELLRSPQRKQSS